MPTFIYVVINPDGSDGAQFEIEQSLNDAPLTKHPLTGAPLRRVFSPLGLATQYSDGEMKRKSSDESYLASRGFTKYVRDTATGVYHKTAGTDPNAPETFRKPRGNELLPHEDKLLHGDGCSCSSCRKKR
jgi:predicted nucleic acid-binding Zn ribbon protein